MLHTLQRIRRQWKSLLPRPGRRSWPRRRPYRPLLERLEERTVPTTIVGLTVTNTLVRFDSATPGTFTNIAPIVGLVAGDNVVGIDFRPATGVLFGLGVNGATAHLYTINATTGEATQLGGNITLPQSAGVAGTESDFGFDFNPVADRIRVVANNTDNFRLNPITGAVAGADTALNPGTPVVVAAAYTNSFAGATSTTLFDIDSNTDQLFIQGGNPVPPGASPNLGTLTLVGNLGFDTSNVVGFDIAPGTGTAFAALTVGGTSGLYTINLGSGVASLVGNIGGGGALRGLSVAPITFGVTAPSLVTGDAAFNFNVTALDPFGNTVTDYGGTVQFTSTDIAATLPANSTLTNGAGTFNAILRTSGNQTITATDTAIATITGTSNSITVKLPTTIVGLTTVNTLVHFDSATPGTVSAPTAITGLVAGDVVRGIDFRPATGGLYGLGVSAALTIAHLYLINPITGAATQIGGDIALPQSAGVAGTDSTFGFDFNPVVDRIRVVANNGDNFRLHPDTGAVAGADTALNPGTPAVVGAAYTNSFAGATSTTLYDIDSSTNPDQLVIQGGNPVPPGASPNLGTLSVVGSLGIEPFSPAIGFDIAQGTGTAFASLDAGPTTSGLYTIDLATGAATLVGNFPIGTLLFDISVAQATQFAFSVPASATAGTAFDASIAALDPFGVVASGYSGTVHFTSSDSQATLPADTTLTNGVGQFSATLRTAGNQTITATDTVATAKTGTSNPIAVTLPTTIVGLNNANQLVRFDRATPGTLSAPTPITGLVAGDTVRGIDVRPATGGLYGLGVNGAFTIAHLYLINPVTGAATQIGGNITLPQSSGVSGTEFDFGFDFNPVVDRIRVVANNRDNFRLNPNDGTVAGADTALNPGTPVVSAVAYTNNFAGATSTTLYDIDASTNPDQLVIQGGNPVPPGTSPNSGTLTVVGSLGLASSNVAHGLDIAQGTGTAFAEIEVGANYGFYTIDLATGTATLIGNFPAGTVLLGMSVAQATTFAITVPANATAGVAFNFTITALDPFGVVASGYNGTVHFTSSDGQAVLPADTTLTNGVGTFSAMLKTAGNQTITATDTVATAKTGTSSAVAVGAAATTQFSVSAPGVATAGSAFNFTVTALDPFNNLTTGYAGTVHFTSSDGTATLPADSTLTNGTGSFSATLRTAGSQTITATDTLVSSVTGTSGAIAVSPSTATKFAVGTPPAATAGTAFNFTVTAQDQFNNTAIAYAGTVHFTSSDGQAVLPADATLTNGTGSFSATLRTAGSQTITATDTTTSSITGTSNGIAVGAAAATKFALTAPGTANTGTSFSFTVTAQDQFNNTATGYAGAVHFTSTDPAAVLPADTTLTFGTGSFNAQLNTAGNRTITATDTVTSSITGTSNTITVTSTTSAPTFTSANSTTFTVGTAGTFTITTNGSPTPTISSTGTLPGGVTFTNNGNGTATLAGTPAAGSGGTYQLTFTATNGISPDATQSFTLTVHQAPEIISADNTTFTVGQAGSFSVNTTGFPVPTVNLAGTLPAGVTFDMATAVLSGTPAAGTAGDYPLTFIAINGVSPDDVQNFTLQVRNIRVFATGAGFGGGPQVNVFDASTRAQVASFFAFNPAFFGGVSVAVGDVNGDDVQDIIVGAGPGGGPHVKVIDGTRLNQLDSNFQIADSALLASFFPYNTAFTGGVFVGAGRFHLGANLDVITGAGAGGGPNVRVFDIAGGQATPDTGPLGSFFAYSTSFVGGVTVAAGDLNGDGLDELITGAGPGGGPHVRSFGQDGSPGLSFFAYESTFTGGVFVSAGRVAAGTRDQIFTGKATGSPQVKVFDGISAAELASFFAFDPAFGGGVRIAGIARIGSRTADLIAAAGPGGGPNVRSFDLTTQTQVDNFFAYDLSFTGGVFVGA